MVHVSGGFKKCKLAVLGLHPWVGKCLGLILSNYFSQHFELLFGTWCHYILVVSSPPLPFLFVAGFANENSFLRIMILVCDFISNPALCWTLSRSHWSILWKDANAARSSQTPFLALLLQEAPETALSKASTLYNSLLIGCVVLLQSTFSPTTWCSPMGTGMPLSPRFHFIQSCIRP